jgi:hypothetical protein
LRPAGYVVQDVGVQHQLKVLVLPTAGKLLQCGIQPRRVAHELRRCPGTRQVKSGDGKDELAALGANLAGDQRIILMRKALIIPNRPPDAPLTLCLQNGVVRAEGEAKLVVQLRSSRSC